MSRLLLPIDEALPRLLDAVRSTGAVVLRAPTGAGKTTRVPPALVDSGLAGHGLVIVLEPRRVAARAAARRMASESGTALGDIYGYQVRFDRRAGPRTRVLVVTPGVLLRMFQDNPFLERISAVVFDEFHERSLDADLALGMVKLVRENVRPDLIAVVMSATIDSASVSAYFGNCPVVDSKGRTYPVDVKYRPRRLESSLPVAVATAVRDLLDTTNGDVLAFLPGLREIHQSADELAARSGVVVLPLHGDLPPEQQDAALQRHERRKVVLATNVAETSVTVEGVTAVVDSGVARQLEFEPSLGMDRLQLVPISRASADQRAGRAGRMQPGVCVRLWDETSHRSRPEQTEPEIRRIDLCGAILQVLALGERDPARFPWLDPPKPEVVQQSLDLLDRLDLVHHGVITEMGKAASRLPIHPRLGRMLLEGYRLGIAKRAALAAALLSDRDPFVRGFDTRSDGRALPASRSDVLDRLEAMEAFERWNQLDSHIGQLHRSAAFGVLEVRDQLARMEVGTLAQPLPQVGLGEQGNDDERLLRSILAAYPDRIAKRREPNSPRALLVGGRGVKLAPTSAVREAELFVCVDVDASGVDSLVRIASGIERTWLPRERINIRNEIEFETQTERLAARKRTRFDNLILEETPAHIADECEAARILAAAAMERLEKVLPDAESDAGRFRTRVRCLRAWMPELELPAFDASDLAESLVQLARGRRSLSELRTGPWLDVLKGQLTYPQQRSVGAEAPERLEVPSGSLIRIDYEEGRPPVLAVRIQELFGLTETPRLAVGRVKVLLHLLAPNYRPQQVTDDLASFWKNGYPLVRKELRGRYPKHSWPEDPLVAAAISGPKRK